MSEVHFYEINLKWTEQKKGLLSASGLPDIEVATPPQFSGGHEGIWSPEHLFVSSVAVCIMTTFLAIAELSKLEFVSYESRATGKLEKVDNKYMFTEVTIEPIIKIKYEKDLERAERIIHKAEANCLISNSIKSKVVLNPKIQL
ncbi:MAG: OsmC family protein [Ignavibacteria bacterium]|jgi:peroxiredoxin-like protein|nr:OsmC family protein [Ignavibacteria bacterium]MDH7528858.1 OsmC family protein [Ignavibacteria bacterium]